MFHRINLTRAPRCGQTSSLVITNQFVWPHIDSKQEHTHTHSSLADQTDGTDPGWVCRFYFSTWTDQDSQHHHLLHIPSGLHLPSSPLGLRLQQLARRSASIKWSKKHRKIRGNRNKYSTCKDKYRSIKSITISRFSHPPLTDVLNVRHKNEATCLLFIAPTEPWSSSSSIQSDKKINLCSEETR